MKKILITISGLHFHKDEGAKNRLNSFINSYDKLGFQVEVLLFFSILSLPYIFSKKKYLNSKARWYLFPTLPVSINPFLAKIAVLIDQISIYIFTTFKKYIFIQAEMSGTMGKYLEKENVFVVDFHGDAVSEAEFKGGENSERMKDFFLRDQSKSIQYADYVIGVSEQLIKQLIKNTGLEIPNYSIVSCGVDVERYNIVEEPNLEKELSGRIVVGYLGGLQKWQNIDSILNIVENLRKINKAIFFMLYTNSSLEPIQSKLNKLGKENYMVKSLNFDEVPKYLKLLDAGFLIREDIPLNIVSSPTKTGEYLAAGVPVICTQFSGDYKRSVNHSIEGFILYDINISTNETFKLNDFLIKVKNNRKHYNQLCLSAASKRDWSNEFDVFLKELRIIENE